MIKKNILHLKKYILHGALAVVPVALVFMLIYTIGFVTGSMVNINSGEKLLKVFIPTPPNPLSGTMIILKEQQVIDPGWTIDEAIRTVISAGIIGPKQIQLQKPELTKQD